LLETNELSISSSFNENLTLVTTCNVEDTENTGPSKLIDCKVNIFVLLKLHVGILLDYMAHYFFSSFKSNFEKDLPPLSYNTELPYRTSYPNLSISIL
jgi:hypothetical protein